MSVSCGVAVVVDEVVIITIRLESAVLLTAAPFRYSMPRVRSVL